MKMSNNLEKGWLYWGLGPLPPGMQMEGVVSFDGGEPGALIKSATGRYYQGNRGVLRSLPVLDDKDTA